MVPNNRNVSSAHIDLLLRIVVDTSTYRWLKVISLWNTHLTCFSSSLSLLINLHFSLVLTSFFSISSLQSNYHLRNADFWTDNLTFMWISFLHANSYRVGVKPTLIGLVQMSLTICNDCQSLNVCVPSDFICWNPNTQSDGIRR